MKGLDNNNLSGFFRNVCIVMIWCIALYSSIIQYKYFQISNGMAIIGIAILISYFMVNSEEPFDLREALMDENKYMLLFLIYIFLVGMMLSPNRNRHFSQWITCLEYLFIQIVISSIIQSTGSDTFSALLYVEAIALAFIFLRAPIDYIGSGRYSISNEVNPNGLGMAFASGIWAVLCRQQVKKLPLILVGASVALFGYCILLTGSRKALIAAGLTIVLWLFFCFLPSLKRRGLFLGITSFLVLLLLVFMIARSFFDVYSDSNIALRMGNLLNAVVESNRSNMYREGYELLKINPIFGIGFQGFSYYYGLYSHATLVEIPVSGGIIGTFLYFCAYFISIKRQVYIYRNTRGEQPYGLEHVRIKMVIILFVVMCFYTTCIIHPYQFESGILFGIIFGETAYLGKRLNLDQETPATKKRGSKYIKYE